MHQKVHDGIGGGRRRRRSGARTAASVLAGTLMAAGTGVVTSAATAGASSKSPVVIGASLSLSGDFSADGQAFQRGYELWQHDVNKHGGMLGHRVKLKVISDASSTSQVSTNYNTLIASDHAKLVVGPFSSLLTVPAAKVAHRFGYAMVEGAGGAPSVFKAHLNNVFDVSYPVATGLVPFAKWIASMPKSQRPATAAYATITTIFESGQFPIAHKILENAGVKTVYTKAFPTETTDFTPIASAAAASKATIFLLGCTDVPTVSSFIQDFQQAHYNPKAFIATAGPDQGAAYVKAVGAANATGTMVEGGWNGTYTNAQSKKMVREYIAKYGGTPSGVNADVAEAYGVGQVLSQAVQHVGSFTNKKLIKYLHSGHTFHSVQGPVKFSQSGENVTGSVFEYQWQTGGTKFNQVLPAKAPGTVGKPMYPKSAFGG
ncbi:MAG: ABC transporter substrate-binding protein [Acidimicrobiales bacterium]